MLNGGWSFEVEQKMSHWSMSEPQPQKHRSVEMLSFCLDIATGSLMAFPSKLHLLSDDSLKNIVTTIGSNKVYVVFVAY